MLAIDPTENEDARPANALYVMRADGTGSTVVLGGDDRKREPEWRDP